MDLKINVEFDLSEFIERWGDESLEQCIKDEIKCEVLSKVKASDEYKAIIKKKQELMMKSLDLL